MRSSQLASLKTSSVKMFGSVTAASEEGAWFVFKNAMAGRIQQYQKSWLANVLGRPRRAADAIAPPTSVDPARLFKILVNRC